MLPSVATCGARWLCWTHSVAVNRLPGAAADGVRRHAGLLERPARAIRRRAAQGASKCGGASVVRKWAVQVGERLAALLTRFATQRNATQRGASLVQRRLRRAACVHCGLCSGGQSDKQRSRAQAPCAHALHVARRLLYAMQAQSAGTATEREALQVGAGPLFAARLIGHAAVCY